MLIAVDFVDVVDFIIVVVVIMLEMWDSIIVSKSEKQYSLEC